MLGKPAPDPLRVRIRGKDGVEDVLDAAVTEHECKPLDQLGGLVAEAPGELEHRKPERPCESQLVIAQQRKRQMQARDRFALVVCRLRAQSEYACVERLELRIAVAVGAGLRG